eukprot:3873855-Pyramimonas_sp.AAC.1
MPSCHGSARPSRGHFCAGRCKVLSSLLKSHPEQIQMGSLKLLWPDLNNCSTSPCAARVRRGALSIKVLAKC